MVLLVQEGRDRKRTGRIDAMLRSAGSTGAVKAPPVLALEKADVRGGYDGTLQERRVAAVAAATAGEGAAVDGAANVYDERVRKRGEREALQAWECQECMEFYELLAKKGYEYNADVFGGCVECGAGAPKRMKLKRSAGAQNNGVTSPGRQPSTPEGNPDGAGALLQAPRIWGISVACSIQLACFGSVSTVYLSGCAVLEQHFLCLFRGCCFAARLACAALTPVPS